MTGTELERMKRAIGPALAGSDGKLNAFTVREAALRLCVELDKEEPGPRRRAAYAAIDTEREYQFRKWGQETGGIGGGGQRQDNPLTVGEFVLLLIQYASKAAALYVTEHKPCINTMGVVRKVAAIAVNAMEQHGAFPREPEELAETCGVGMQDA